MIKKILIGFLAFILLLGACGYLYYRFFLYQPPPISEKDRAAIQLMPLPAALKLGNGQLNLARGLNINYPNEQNERLEKAVDRFLERLQNKTRANIRAENGIEFHIDCLEGATGPVPSSSETESYVLTIERNRILLKAPSSLGILHGLETLIQLLEQKDDSWTLPHVSISDKPRFSWRGIMIDVSRHWIPKDVILRTLDAMATVKMNVFHWHLSDDQGFRVESKVFPKLHEDGSNGLYYTQEDIREVIRFAADRGIRVVPEFDMPGHSKSWQIAYPELSSVSYPLTFGRQDGELFAPPIDPTKEEVYDFLDRFVEEMAALFPDPYFHIGGDEVNPQHWEANPDIQQFMSENQLKDAHALQAYFNRRMEKILKKHGKRMLGWNEIFHPDLSEEVVIQAWTSHRALFEAVQNGGTGLLSYGLYLDHILPAEKHYAADPLVLAGAIDLEPDTTHWKMYHLVMDFAGTEIQTELVIFDRDPEEVFGFFALGEDRTPFKNGKIENNKLQFTLEGPAGEMDFKADLDGDSLRGSVSLALLNFPTRGHKTGGSDQPGTRMPRIEVMRPLTEEEESRILGGEACQWSEFVDHANVESRIWPRAAAIAEKLWSPASLSVDVPDMYRRLKTLSDQLTEQGSHHDIQYTEKLKIMIPAEGLESLTNLTDFLEEVKYHGRMPDLFEREKLYLPDFPLDRIVDAVRPESWPARDFNQQVDKYLAGPKDQEVKDEIITQLKIWEANHQSLASYYQSSEKLQEVENISRELSVVARAAIQHLENGTDAKEQIMEKLAFLETGEHGVILAVAPGLRRLLMAK